MSDAAPEKTVQPRRSRRPWGRWMVAGVFNLVMITVLVAAAGIFWITDRPLEAPGWLRDRIEDRIAQNAPDLRITARDMWLTVESGWRPSVQLRDVEISSVTGENQLELADLDLSLAMRPLLEGQIQPKHISLSGIFATLRRDADGQLGLVASAAAGASERQAGTLAELVEQLDDLFERPELSALSALDVDAITLRFEDARARRAWTIDGARLQVTREGQDLQVFGDLAILGGGAGVATVSASYDSVIGDPAAGFGVTVADLQAGDLAAFSPAFGWLDALRAPISGSLRGGITREGDLAPVNATLQIDAGVLQPTRETRPVPFNSARTYFTFDPAANVLEFDELAIDSAWVKGTADGRAQLVGLERGQLETLIAQFSLQALSFNPPGLYDEPITLEGAELDFRLIPQPFRLDLGQLRLVDMGQSLLVDGGLEAAPDGWKLALNAHMDALAPERLLQLWPKLMVGKTRTWVADNLNAGFLENIEFALRSVPSSKPDSYLSFDFSDAEVRYLKTFPPIANAKGTASILRNRFVVAVDAGAVQADEGGLVNAAGSSFIIPDVAVKDGAPAVVRLVTDGSITATLALLNEAPLSVMDRAGLPVSLAAGRARAETTLAFPLRRTVPAEEIEYSVMGTLQNVRSDALVQGRVVAAPELAVTATQEGIVISGAGTFDDLPVDVRWAQVLGPEGDGTSTLTAQVEVSDRAVKALDIGLPPGSVSGLGQGELSVLLARGTPPAFSLESDLRGVGLSVPALGWSLPRSRGGKLEVVGLLGDRPQVDRLVLDAPGLDARGKVSLAPQGGLAEARFERVRIGGWLDAPVTLIGRGQGVAPDIRVEGGSLDLRQAAFGSGGGSGGGSSGSLTLALNKLQITDTIALTDMRAKFNLSQGLQGDFTGRVNGLAPVTGQVEPAGNRSAFRIRSGDAGAVFSAAGLLKQARGGEMSLILQPVGTAGGFNGSLNVQNTRISDAPAIAALFNALSVVGLIEQMGGQGLHFGEVEAAFRLTPERVTLTQASAVGPSIGLSMDGTYDVNSAQMDMRGVFSPIYLINGVGSILTRRGEGLIGFNFRLTGPASKPNVQVNPLSALTPSIFREIFRRPPPEIIAEPGEEPGAAPQLQARPERDRGAPVIMRGQDR